MEQVARTLRTCKSVIGAWEYGKVTLPGWLELALPEASRRLKEQERERGKRRRRKARAAHAAMQERRREESRRARLKREGVLDGSVWW